MKSFQGQNDIAESGQLSGRTLTAGSYFLDDLQVGDHFQTGRTEVTAEIISDFAAVSGDSYELHLNDRFAQEIGFPGIIAHGILVMALADGLKYRSEVKLDAVASLGWDIAFTAPVFVGDTISATVTVKEKRVTGKPNRGIATLEFVIVNQHGKPVQRGDNLLMMRRRPGEDGGGPQK